MLFDITSDYNKYIKKVCSLVPDSGKFIKTTESLNFESFFKMISFWKLSWNCWHLPTLQSSVLAQRRNKSSTFVCSFFRFPQDTTLEEMVQQMGVMVGFVSKPKVVRDGRAAMCVLRPPSAKELSQKGKKETAASQTDNATPSKTVSNTDTTEETLQQWSDGNKHFSQRVSQFGLSSMCNYDASS